MPTNKLTPEIIIAAIEGFEQSKLRIDAQIAELRSMLPGSRTEAVATPEPPKQRKGKRKMSAAGRANIVAALKKRWAAKKAAAKKTSPTVAKKPSVKKSAARKSAAKTTAPAKTA